MPDRQVKLRLHDGEIGLQAVFIGEDENDLAMGEPAAGSFRQAHQDPLPIFDLLFAVFGDKDIRGHAGIVAGHQPAILSLPVGAANRLLPALDHLDDPALPQAVSPCPGGHPHQHQVTGKSIGNLRGMNKELIVLPICRTEETGTPAVELEPPDPQGRPLGKLPLAT